MSIALLLVTGPAVTFLLFLMTGESGVSSPGDWRKPEHLQYPAIKSSIYSASSTLLLQYSASTSAALGCNFYWHQGPVQDSPPLAETLCLSPGIKKMKLK